MVYPSPGCSTCKARHLKCDSVGPRCSRCRRSCLDCIWNPDQESSGLSFKSENAFAQGRPRRARRRKPEADDGAAGQVAGQVALSKSKGAVARFTSTIEIILPVLSLPVEDCARNYWAENYVFRLDELPDIGHEVWTYVAPFWERSAPECCYRLALSAVAHAVFGRANRVDKAVQDADVFYTRSIGQISQQIAAGHISDQEIDQLLLTTMLMANYENRRCGHQYETWPFMRSDIVGSRLWMNFCHHQGASSLLKLRQQRGLPSHDPLPRAVRRQMIRTCILRGVPVPDWIQSGEEYGEQGPALVLDILMVQVAALRARSLTLFEAKDAPQPPCLHFKQAQNLTVEAQALDVGLEMWAKNVPDDWKFTTPSSSTAPGSEPLPDHVRAQTYASFGHAAVWNRYRATRLLLNSIRMRSLLLLIQRQPDDASLTEQKAACQKNLDEVSLDLCSGVMFFVDGNNPQHPILPKMTPLLAWSLTVAVNVESIPHAQREWLKAKLVTMGRTYGDVILESVAEGGEFKF